MTAIRSHSILAVSIAHAHCLWRAWNMLRTCTTKEDTSSDSAAESIERHKLYGHAGSFSNRWALQPGVSATTARSSSSK